MSGSLGNIFVFFISPLTDLNTAVLKQNAVTGKWKGQDSTITAL